jgi:hypothetical protein
VWMHGMFLKFFLYAVMCSVHLASEFSSCLLTSCVFAFMMCRHLVWEDGYCGHASCPVGSETSEVGCEQGSGVCALVRKVMASQVHIVGEGYARIAYGSSRCP